MFLFLFLLLLLLLFAVLAPLIGTDADDDSSAAELPDQGWHPPLGLR